MRKSFSAGLVAVALVFTACNGSSSGLPSNPQTVSQMAGEYAGTATDSSLGNGTAAVTLSQKASSIGGTLTTTFGATTISQSLALTIDLSGNLAGSSVATVNPASPTCGFNIAAAYDPNSGVVKGTYASYSGCTGESGSFTLTQQCTDPSLPSMLKRRPEGGHGLLPC